MNVGVGGKQALMEDGFFHDANGTKVAVYTGLSPPPQSARPEAQLAKPETQSGLRPSQPGLKPEVGWLAGWSYPQKCLCYESDMQEYIKMVGVETAVQIVTNVA